MLGSLDFVTFIIIFVVLVIAITIHEAMHAFTSHWLGDDTAHLEGRISLNPVRHVDPVGTVLLPLITLVLFQAPLLAAKPVPFNPSKVKFEEFGAALVALVGPLTNLAMAILGAAIINIFQGSLGLDLLRIVSIFVTINIALFVFNMIPIPPLDGSRVLYACAPEPVQNLMAQLEQIGIIIVFALVLGVPAFRDLLYDLNGQVLQLLIGL